MYAGMADIAALTGDSAYIDSKMRHAFLNRGKGKAEMLSFDGNEFTQK